MAWNQAISDIKSSTYWWLPTRKNVKSGNTPKILQVIPSYNPSSTLAPNCFIYKIPFILVVMVDTDNT